MKQLIILFIIALLSGLVYFLTKKTNSKLIPSSILFVLGFGFAFFVPLSLYTIGLLDKAILNLAPAMVFLYAIDFDIKKLLKNSIGCSCKMGAKKYWFFVLLSIVISFASQVLAISIYSSMSFLISIIISGVLGFMLGKTRIKELDGNEDIATTMLYLLATLSGMKLFLVVQNLS